MKLVCLLISLLPCAFISSKPLLLVDLSHTITPTIPYFPSQVRFNFTQQTVSTNHGYFYSSNAFVSGEHMGTHLDAPYHFHPTGWKVHEIPLERLLSINARLIDVSKQCQNDRNYLITIDDVEKADVTYPEKDENTGERFRFVLIFYTGFTKYWPDQKLYAGEDSNPEFPGLSEQLANYLIEKYPENLVGVGIDTLSTDYGQTKTYPVHQILAKHNKYGLENLALNETLMANLGRRFFQMDILPLKIGNGTGAPSRIIARLDNRYKTHTNWFAFLIFVLVAFLAGFVVKILYDFRFNPNKDF